MVSGHITIVESYYIIVILYKYFFTFQKNNISIIKSNSHFCEKITNILVSKTIIFLVIRKL